MSRLEARAPSEASDGEVPCPEGHPPVAFKHSPAVVAGSAVDRCSRCGTTAFFVQKDFDQRVGCAVLGAGALLALAAAKVFGGIWLVPVLLAVAAADFVLARRIPSVVICYQCDTEYRGVPGSSGLRPYDPHIGERYAEVKTVRRLTR